MNIPRARRFPYRPRPARSRSVLTDLTINIPDMGDVARAAGVIVARLSELAADGPARRKGGA